MPVVALAGSAVPETMGQAGILIHHWDTPRLAELINLLLKDEVWRSRLLANQQQNLTRFNHDAVRQRLAAAVKFLTTAEVDSWIALTHKTANRS